MNTEFILQCFAAFTPPFCFAQHLPGDGKLSLPGKGNFINLRLKTED